MNRNILVVVVAFGLSAAGCDYNRYEIEMSVRGQKLERRLTVARITGTAEPTSQPATAAGTATQPSTSPAYTYGNFDPNELARIAGCYHKRLSGPNAERHVFVDQFIGRLPQDVGGSGWFQSFPTHMGTAYVYSEQLRGNDDLCAELERRQAAADRLTELLIGWMQQELGKETGFDHLREFLDKDLRRDIKNLSLLDWTGNVTRAYLKQEAEPNTEEVVFRACHYLANRGYFQPEEIPRIVAEYQDASDGRPEPLCARVQRLVANKMRFPCDRPIPKSLEFLKDWQSINNSFDSYAQTTPQYAEKLLKWQQHVQSDPNLARPTGSEILEPLAQDLVTVRWGMAAAESQDEIRVVLHLDGPPIWTNGRKKEAEGTLTWDYRLLEESDRPDRDFPSQAYAVWVRPDEPFQREHFGHTVLEGEGLFLYCLWRSGLGENEASEWDAMLAALTPEQDALKVLQGFRLSDEPASQPVQGSPSRHRASPATQAIGEGVRRVREAATQPAPSGSHK